MTEHLLTTWLLTYAVHSALFAALAAVTERTYWGAVASRRDAFWKLALVGGIVTSIVFVAAGSAPTGAAVHLSPGGLIPPALRSDGVTWTAAGWIAMTAILALRTARSWRLGLRHVGRRRVIRRGRATVILQEILGPAADRVTLTCSRTLRVPVAFAREICVPVRALRELPDDELRALLAHEAAHIIRRDAAWLTIAAIIRALGWWQPLNFVAAARLRAAMELCCDEQAATEPPQRAALARCLITVAEWSVENHLPGFAAMASRGSALRLRLETLLDDDPRLHRRMGPWLAVMSVAVPAVCLAPVVTTVGLAPLPAVAARLVRQAQVPQATARSVPAPRGAAQAAAAHSSKAVAGRPPIAASSDRTAVLEMSHDDALPTLSESMLPDPIAEPQAAPASPSIPLGDAIAAAPITSEPDAASRHRSTRLRDSIAAARITPEPAPRMRLDAPDRESGPWSRIARHVGFDTTRPKLDAPTPAQLALSRMQRAAFDTTRQK